MTEEIKGRSTTRDIAHGMPTVVAGGIDFGNLEPLLRELTLAVRAISLSVNVPPGVVTVAPPEVTVNVPPSTQPTWVAPAFTPPAVSVVVPKQWVMATLLFLLLLSDILIKLLDIYE